MSDWLAWQVLDSAFPTGLFAHSWGLESMWQHGEIETLEDLRVLTQSAIVQSGYATLPFVNAAFDTPGRLEQLDLLADAFLTNAVANRASRIQGRTLIATAARVWPSDRVLALKVRADSACAHVAPLYGSVFGALGLPLPTTQRIVLHGTVRGVLSAAVRLGIAGTYEAQRIQHACVPTLEHTAHECAGVSVDDLAQTAPLIDVFQMRHDVLYSRLFQS